MMESAWEQRSPWLHALKPLEWLYRVLVYCRRELYRRHIFSTRSSTLPVLVVGNLRVGGSGKTPLVIALVELLRSEGWRPGVVSRGYAGKSPGYPLRVGADTPVEACGDEAKMTFLRTRCPVFVAPRRVQAIQAAQACGDCDVLLSDDGLQHYAMARDIEIVLVDSVNSIAQESCLPCGPLREPAARLAGADWVLETASTAPGAVQFVSGVWVNLESGQRRGHSEMEFGSVIHALAGIARPERFFAVLSGLGVSFKAHRFADHYRYQAKDLQSMLGATVLMTEKDAVKCRGLAGDDSWYLESRLVLPQAFQLSLLKRVRELTVA